MFERVVYFMKCSSQHEVVLFNQHLYPRCSGVTYQSSHFPSTKRKKDDVLYSNNTNAHTMNHYSMHYDEVVSYKEIIIPLCSLTVSEVSITVSVGKQQALHRISIQY